MTDLPASIATPFQVVLLDFRHGAKESTRKVCVDGLLEDREYRVLDMDGNEIVRMFGSLLKEEGFDVTIEETFGGRLFEIALL